MLDTPREEAFDRFVRLVQNIFDVPIALISLMDAHRQWYKACAGLTETESELRHSFCRYPVENGQPLIVADTSCDARFEGSPYVRGRPGIRFYAGVPLQTEGGVVIGTLCAIDTKPRDFAARDLQILTDLSQVVTETIELRRQAETDALTRLLSRRAFEEHGSRAVALARRHKHPLSCIALDIDHFKAVNDTFGHPAGDDVLKGVAVALQTQLRKSDIVGRLGGEEFAVLLPHTEHGRACDVAEKLRRAVRRKRTDPNGDSMRVTASFGVASLNSSIKDIDALLAEADRALYAAKAQGRDCCVSLQREDRPARRRVLKAGRIIFNDRFSTIDCTIRSLGDDGAGLEVWNALDVPDSFTLMIGPEAEEKQCRVVSRTGKHIEAEFR